MRNLALVWVLAACLLGCGGREAKDKVAAAVASDTVAVLPDTATIAPDTDTTLTDTRDGKVYKKVTIGKQVWMAENLDYAAKGSKCYDNKAANCAKYGRLYDWNTAMKACPVGWHLPSDGEWTMLESAIGSSTAGMKLRSKTGWNDYGKGTDEYGFSTLPGGNGNSDGNFNYAGYYGYGYWWSATEIDAYYAWYRYMNSYDEYVHSSNYYRKTYLLSVRCVLDDEKDRRK